ncbi:uncharacterized protein DUF4424 [Stella humosa]|uniref:Uncharacterized protein DUF4424 n=1 Tax=Stella humosa TaxID=94 RepID=A0A3N1LXS9_9PROT|nr:DUF4424 family protein [Stella humosa]ROQ00004.1 uncharacterized protein DUF4424 [Stella humosa]BBK30765.1 hypothetical protein STHU_13990 [Stella humosa]
MRRWLALPLMLAALPAAANDSTAVLAAGGLVLTRAETIAMEREDLHISPAEIRVRYRFRNTGPAPVETLVAFPLPEIDLSQMAETPITAPGADPDDFVDFRVAVDGRPVVAALEMRAWRDGVEVTETLRRHGLPVSRFHPDLYPRLRAMAPPGRAELTAAGIAAWEGSENVYPLWTMRAAYHWRQAFPPGQPVEVEHRYRPVVGESWFGQYLLADSEEGRKWRADHCVDDRAVALLRAKLALATAMEPYRRMRTVEYVLTTARNWQGPIGRFRLTVDAGSPDAVMATCLPGLEATDYVPDRELSVAIVE